MLTLDAHELELVHSILALHVPGAEVRAFGSRVSGTARPYSDLDLLVRDVQPLSLRTIDDLIDAFQESDLPFRVDVVDWHRTAEPFRNAALAGSEIIRAGNISGT